MTLDEVLTIANRVCHFETTSGAERFDAFGYIWTNADQIRRAHKLKEVEARCAALLSENEAFDAENTKLEESVSYLLAEREALEAEMTEKNKALADLMVELHKLKKAR